MIDILLNLLFWVVVAVVVFLVVKYIMGEAELDPPIRKIILIILGIVFLVLIVNSLTGHRMWGPVF